MNALWEPGWGIELALPSLLWLIPAIAAAVVAIVPARNWFAGGAGMSAMLFTLGLLAFNLGKFDPDGGVQFRQVEPWVEDLGVSYAVGMDGLSLVLVGLVLFAFPVALSYGLWAGRDNLRGYVSLLLVLEAALVLLFVARDLLLFYVGFEAMLIPLVFLIGIWGGARRAQATVRFVVYTLIGSLLMLILIITLGVEAGTFALDGVGTSESTWLFLAFMAAFAIKAPLYPFHGWVPDAYRESSPEIAGLLSGIVSKAGAYGMLRFALPIFPEPFSDLQVAFIVLALFGLLWCSLVAFRQPDSRGVVAYSSIAQMSLIGLGIFVLQDAGATGAAAQMVNHGLLSLLLFLLAGFVEVRFGTGLFSQLGRLAKGRAALATICITTGVATLAVPGSNLFASEFLVLLGAFREYWLIGAAASLAIVLAAMYMLRWISAVLHDEALEGEPRAGEGHPSSRTRSDVRWEAIYIVPLVAAVLFLSAYPAFVTDRVDESVIALTQAAVEAGR